MTAYIRDERDKLLTRAVAQSNTFSNGFTEVIPGIKRGTSKKMKFYATTLGYQWETDCADVSGTTTFTEKLLSTGLVTVYDKWCTDQLSAKLAPYLPPGASTEGFEIPTEIMDNVIDQFSRDNAIAFYQAKRKTPSNAIEANMEGVLFKLINNGASSYSGSTFKPTSTYTSITSANVIAAINDWKTNIPAEMQNVQKIIRAGYDFTEALKAAYLTAYGAGSLQFLPNSVDSFRLIGDDTIIVERDNGLAGAKVALMSVADEGNLMLTTDLSSDTANIEFWRDANTDTVRYRIKAALGTAIKFESHVGVLNYNTGSLAN